MRKSIRLAVRLNVEGEDEPAHDFASSSIQAVQDILNAGRWRHPKLKLTVTKIEEESGDDDAGTGS